MPPNVLTYAIPVFLVLLVAEAVFDAVEKRDLYERRDTAASLAMGLGNVVVGLIGKAVVFGAFWLVYEHRLWTVPMDRWWAWVALFFADDFSYYWFHRTAHERRFFWASHVVHHSSERYNLSTALRQTWTGNLTGSFVFWLWLPLVGVHPVAVMTMQAISLIYQFWIHTEAIGRLPRWIEAVFNTPSHHRVHHGSDAAYLDRNHAGVLIVWDRLFGTFTPETHRPTYGLTTNVGSHNPVRIAFHEWDALARDATQPGLTLRQRLAYVFGPPGYRHDGTGQTASALRAAHAAAERERAEDRPATDPPDA